MKSETRLDSVVFQLTPTRTRCDLVIIASGRTEKLASGLLNPFLAHLKAAQDQIAKGGYSITLVPDSGKDTTWFTKGTVDRFVRFVSTPEVLERVNTIEAEILQIGEAISIQNNENLGINTVDDDQKISSNRTEGVKSLIDSDAEKAIVLYEPEAHPPESNVSTTQQENSKVQLLRVLETRKTVLRNEQGMAFARAAAAGFDLDHMAQLILFAECFGASRLMDACLRFIELWKQKHETGQWVEVEAAEVMSAHLDFSSSLNISGILMSGEQKEQRDFKEGWIESHGELEPESNCKVSADAGFDNSFQHSNMISDSGKTLPVGSQVPSAHHHQEYFQGQFQLPMYAQWPMNPSPAGHMFQHYPVQGMPYYHNYPGGRPFVQTPNGPLEDHRHNPTQRMGHKKHAVRGKDSYSESEESTEESFSGSENDDKRNHRSKVGRSGRKKSGSTANQNRNSVASKMHNTSGSELESASEPESEREVYEVRSNSSKKKHKNSAGSSKSNRIHNDSIDTWNSNNGNDLSFGPETVNGNWQAFQNCLLREGEESISSVGRDVFSSEKEIYYKRKQSAAVSDPILDCNRDIAEVPEQCMHKVEAAYGNGIPVYRQKSANDEFTTSNEGLYVRDAQVDLQFEVMDSRGRGYRRIPTDSFVINGEGDQVGNANSFSDPLVENDLKYKNKIERDFSHKVDDESFIVPYRLNSPNQVAIDRGDVVLESEFPTSLEKSKELSGKRITSQLSYEPDDLSLMPERGTERKLSGHDPAIDYEMEIHVKSAISKDRENGDVTVATNGSKKVVKEKKHGVEMRKVESMTRKGKPSRLSSSTDAQIRAEKLRAYKADLQKIKKEKEEEEIKRLEALKRERQKRIAARESMGGKSGLSTKFSPNSNRGSKFSDAEPISASPLSKLPIRTYSLVSESQKKSSSGKNNGAKNAGNGLSQSVSSLPDLKRETSGNFPDPKRASIKPRRLSDPKDSSIQQVFPQKSLRSDPVVKPKVKDDTEAKKISGILNIDRTKSASLPELKVKVRLSSTADKPQTKAAMYKVSENKVSHTSGHSKLNAHDDNSLNLSDEHGNRIIEKVVVILEKETTTVQDVEASHEALEMLKGLADNNNARDKCHNASGYAAIHAPASPMIVDEGVQGHSAVNLDQQSNSHEVNIDHQKDEVLEFSGSNTANVKNYQAPFARVSSLEDICTRDSEYGKAPAISSNLIHTEIVKAHISDILDPTSRQNNSEVLEKPRNKDSTKGFRRLLKFGRKSHSSAGGERNDSDKLNGNCSTDTTSAFSNEVPTLKNLISQDESPVASTAYKVSRPFSLLSPFRSKTSEKKLTT